MRWSRTKPRSNDVKYVTRFLLVPRMILEGRTRTYYWLETATLTYRYRARYGSNGSWELESIV